MRRTRDASQYFLFLVPAIIAGLSIQYLVKKHHTAVPAGATAATSESGSRSLASGRGERSREHEADSRDEDSDAQKSTLTDDEDVPHKDLSKTEKERNPASASQGAVAGGVLNPDQCSSLEMRGDGMAATQVSAEDWAKTMEVFHQSKSDVQAWLTQHKAEFAGGLSNWMSEQIDGARLQRPPVAEEPDLSWRGIGVATRTGSGADSAPLIRIGGGFVKMVSAQPKRARFEFTRLLAQSWNPCDMPTGAMATWEPLLKCEGLKEQDWNTAKACAPGADSEAGWAVSTSIAAVASPPGCKIPAFQTASVADCIKKSSWLENPRVPASFNGPAIVSDPKEENSMTVPTGAAAVSPIGTMPTSGPVQTAPGKTAAVVGTSAANDVTSVKTAAKAADQTTAQIPAQTIGRAPASVTGTTTTSSLAGTTTAGTQAASASAATPAAVGNTVTVPFTHIGLPPAAIPGVSGSKFEGDKQ